MTFVVPGATLRVVANRSTGISKPTMGLVLHVQAGNNSPYGWFNDPASEASSTWWVSKAGVIEQYIDPDSEHAWAQALGNRAFHSVETEGQPSEPLTGAQMDALAKIYLAGNERWGWPFRLSETPDQPGFGWHGMGGAPWGGHLGCPGNLRKLQRATVLSKAMTLRSAVIPTVGIAPKPAAVKPVVVPRFPLRLGHWFGVNDGTIFSHSGLTATDQPFIRAIQNRVGAGVDGEFGDATKAKVVALQKTHKLATDGKVGPVTWAALYKAV